jgi:hypothetical protein
MPEVTHVVSVVVAAAFPAIALVIMNGNSNVRVETRAWQSIRLHHLGLSLLEVVNLSGMPLADDCLVKKKTRKKPSTPKVKEFEKGDPYADENKATTQ